MTIQYFAEEDVEKLLDMPRAIDVMKRAFVALANGEAYNVPRVRAKGKGIVLHSMCAAADYLGLVGWKQYTTTQHGARFLVGLHDQQSGQLVALIEADRLGQMRTGAVTGLAAKLLAPRGADQVGLIGTGWQAESQLEAIATALPIQRAFCFSRNPARRQEFSRKMSDRLGIDVMAVDEARRAVDRLPVVVTATTSSRPVLDGAWLHAPSLVCAVGSNWLHKAEVDDTTLRRADVVVCDNVNCCQHEAGDLVAAAQSGAFEWSQALELEDLAVGGCCLGESAHPMVVFKSVGMAIEDVAMGGELLRRIEEPENRTMHKSLEIQ